VKIEAGYKSGTREKNYGSDFTLTKEDMDV